MLLDIPKGPSSPYVWLLMPEMDPKSYNAGVLGPSG